MAELLEPFRAALEGAGEVLRNRLSIYPFVWLIDLVVVVVVAAGLYAAGRADGRARFLALASRAGAAIAPVMILAAVATGPWTWRLLAPDGRLSAASNTLAAAWSLAVAGLGLALLRTGVAVRGLRRAAATLWDWGSRPDRNRTRWTDAAFGLGLSVLLVLTVDSAYWVYHRAVRERSILEVTLARPVVPTEPMYVPHPALGYRPRPSSQARVVRRHGSQVVFDVTYRFDAAARRLIPAAPAPAGPPILFFGGSFAMGVGVNDDEVAAARVAAALPDRPVFNYAAGSYGPQHALLHLRRPDLADELPSLAGATAVYIWIDDHLFRARCDLSLLASAAGTAYPCFAPDPDGGLRPAGSIHERRPAGSRVYRLLLNLEVMRAYQPRWPWWATDADIELAAAHFQAAARELASRGRDTRLLIVFYPGSRLAPRLRPLLAAAGIGLVDASDLFDPEAPGYSLPHDGHPTAGAQRELAERLLIELRRGSWPTTPEGSDPALSPALRSEQGG